MKIGRLKDFIQPANINFLIGSGLSHPYLSTLGNIETLLVELSNRKGDNANVISLVKGSIYKSYFESVILPNRVSEKKKRQKKYNEVASNYCHFLETWNQIIHNRGGSLLPKQINIFTTNIDTLIENSAEQCKIELNDGFKGSVKPIFDEGNFHKSYRKNSVHFQNSTELPVFNLLKMHGSINWSENNRQQIVNDFTLYQVKIVADELSNVGNDYFIPLKQNLASMIEDAKRKIGGRRLRVDMTLKKFEEAYEKLILINPTKSKFSETVLDVHFYDLMRMYSNALEKENSLLFVMGFSFADEHILKITERALRTNPTLLVVIFAYDDTQEANFKTKFQSTNNVRILTPSSFNKANKQKEDDEDLIEKFDFCGINYVFGLISQMIPVSFQYGK
jgi:hypothetical protein